MMVRTLMVAVMGKTARQSPSTPTERRIGTKSFNS